MYAYSEAAMNTMETKLNILIDGLAKKEQSLLEIVGITENQSTVLDSELPNEQTQDFILHMNREKQVHIQNVIACDDLFENILKEIGPELDKDFEAYKSQVARIQEGIKRVMDLDVKIRVCEENNNKAMNKRAGTVPPLDKKQKKSAIPKDTSRVIEAYKNNARM
jgi:hypothetical protein